MPTSYALTLGFLAIWFFPREAFPLVWIAPICVLEAIGLVAGIPLLLREFSRTRYQLPVATMMGTMYAGFWWELWNVYSLPKWIYTIPYVGFWKVFEMPILGYLGYPFFGWIVFSYAALMMRLVRRDPFVSLFESKPA